MSFFASRPAPRCFRLVHASLLGAFILAALAFTGPAALAQNTTVAPIEQNAPPATDIPAVSASTATPDAPPADETIPHDLSPWSMFMAADVIVKTVMIGLAMASLLTWTICLVKSQELRAARARVLRLRTALADCRSLDDAIKAVQDAPRRTDATLLEAALLETRMSAGAYGKEGLKERVASRLNRLETAATQRLGKGTGILATIGSTAPFIGLFGTVWGIMNAFIGISQSHTTNLAVVAPGIAEALLATAMGLVAAIPAVVIYNAFSRGTSGYRVILGDVSAEVLRLVSRDLDHNTLPIRTSVAAE